ncbi:hypothetical protein PRIPAC_73952 [Pristionchus pacificus]|uniref:Alpha-amylase n=1 Tax=Pristionchus pacificus TaxID=54126 RepID=A0A2A6BWT4_PRIPA|nr:hypothetical protein PRIPAC_73952 [Pristionchus pacificus]|eukprot:PDM70221.1 hypothetical protein PRIPAC_45525 [Pristionchus pacificus]
MLFPLVVTSLAVATSAGDPYEFDDCNTLFDRQTMVHLFEWKWEDVAKECEDFLQYNGYGAVQVSPPNEHIMIYTNNDVPWWVRYQPVSYRLISRSGTESQFQNMVDRCNKVGVRIIVDSVLNHMVGVGQKSDDPGRGSSGTASFDGRDGIESFPAVPYSSTDFHDPVCHGDIQDSDYHNNANNVRNCRLSGLLDLNHSSTHVRNMVTSYLTSLINMGVGGFRLDASKHMFPNDLQYVLERLPNLKADIFGANQKPFVVHEVIDRGGEAIKVNEYISIGRYTNFNFGAAVASAIWKESDVAGLSTLGPGFGYGNLDDHDILNFIDNHDNQRDDHPYVLTYKNGDEYRMGNAYMLAWTYGYTRVMSSFDFKLHDQGPPNQGAPNYACVNTRWPTIRQMVQFRAVCQGRAATEIVTESNRIAFAREQNGFFAMNNADSDWKRQFDTTLPSGSYCDQYDGELQGSMCTGQTITVDNNGKASFRIPARGCIAFSVISRIGGRPSPPNPPNGNFQKTAIFLQRNTQPGQNVFIRGGSAQAHQCSTGPFKQSTDLCSIPIIHNSTTPWMYATYRQWSQGDEYLDFEGEEQRQGQIVFPSLSLCLSGTYDGTHATGTPLAYSTNDANSVDYQPLNKYGPDYWFVQILMDCDKTENGWFELKGYMNGWENDIKQSSCSGTIDGSNPLKSSNNHVAKCGAVNVYTWNSNSCIVNSF